MHSGNSHAAEMLRSMHAFLKENDMMAYLALMAVRLLELHRVLKPTARFTYIATTGGVVHAPPELIHGIDTATVAVKIWPTLTDAQYRP